RDSTGTLITNLNTATIVFSLSTGAGVSTGTFDNANISNNQDGTYSVTLTGGTPGTAATVMVSVGGTPVTNNLPTVTVFALTTPTIALESLPLAPVEFGQLPHSYTVLITVASTTNPAPTGAISMSIDGKSVFTQNGAYVQDPTNLNQYRVTLTYSGSDL